MSETEVKPIEDQERLILEIQNIQNSIEILKIIAEHQIELGGDHTGIGNNIKSFVDTVSTRKKMLIGTLKYFGWR